MDNTTSLRHRLWGYTLVDQRTGCWAWQGPIDRHGYGKVKFEGKTLQVHRVGAKLVGAPFDEGLTLDHLCRNRACWNPAHLEAVSMRANILRGIGPTAVNAAKTECVRGHPFDEENTQWRFRPGRNPERECRACRRERDHRRNSTQPAHPAPRPTVTPSGNGILPAA